MKTTACLLVFAALVCSADFDPLSWVPAPGTRANINRNTALSVDIDSGKTYGGKWYNGYGGYNSFESMAGAWSGAVWCPGYSAQGALVLFGGGHGANIGAFSYLFDFSDFMWKVVGVNNLPPTSAWMGGYPYNKAGDLRDTSWVDYLYNGSYTFIFDHTYAICAYVPPAFAGNTRGSLLIPNSVVDQTAGTPPRNWAPHLMDLETGIISRQNTTIYGGATGSGNLISINNTNDNRIYYFRQGSNQYYYNDLTEPIPRPLHTGSPVKETGNVVNGYVCVYNCMWEFSPEANMALVVLGNDQSDSISQLHLIDFKNKTPTWTNIVIPSCPFKFTAGSVVYGVAWVPPLNAFYIYEGMGRTYATVLKASGTNFRTCTWTWSREEFTGPAPADKWGANPGSATSLHGVWRRWAWNSALGCLVWTDGPKVSGLCADGVTRDGLVQLWRPADTTKARTELNVIKNPVLNLVAGPNPFTRSAQIQFTLVQPSKVELTVVDVQGRVIVSLFNTDRAMNGLYSFKWDAGNNNRGIYFIRLKTGSRVTTQRLLCL